MYSIFYPPCIKELQRQAINGKDLYESDMFIPFPPNINKTINLNRFNVFLNNINNKVVDSVRLITHDVEDETYIKNLFYDGNSIMYVKDATKISGNFGKPYINFYQGNKIVIEDTPDYINYFLQNDNFRIVLIFFLAKEKYRYLIFRYLYFNIIYNINSLNLVCHMKLAMFECSVQQVLQPLLIQSHLVHGLILIHVQFRAT